MDYFVTLAWLGTVEFICGYRLHCNGLNGLFYFLCVCFVSCVFDLELWIHFRHKLEVRRKPFILFSKMRDGDCYVFWVWWAVEICVGYTSESNYCVSNLAQWSCIMICHIVMVYGNPDSIFNNCKKNQRSQFTYLFHVFGNIREITKSPSSPLVSSGWDEHKPLHSIHPYQYVTWWFYMTNKAS